MNRVLCTSLFAALLVVTACSKKEESSETLTNDFPTSTDIVSIARPTDGFRWIVNEDFSDEFNGTELDGDKWYDYHPTWKGREPGLFMPSQVSVKDGCLVLEGGKMEKDTIIYAWNGAITTYNIKCAAVVAKSHEAHYGKYYECKVKANKTTLSTTFWLSMRTSKVSTAGRQPEGSEVGTFSQELDILECIGRTGDFTGTDFSQRMNSNVHYWFLPSGSSTTEDIRAEECVLYNADGSIPSDDFNVYGCWWRDKASASFYLNNSGEKHIDFANRDTGAPFYFTEKMGLNLVLETYPYPWIELPNDEELVDPTKNKNYYDWVRCYDLVPADTIITGASEYAMFENHLHFYRKSRYFKSTGGNLELQIDYTASKDAEIDIVIYNAKKEAIHTQEVAVPAGYSATTYPVSVSDAQLIEDDSYFAVATLKSAEGTTYETDSFMFTYDGE